MLVNIIMDKLVQLKDKDKNNLKISSDDIVWKKQTGKITKLSDTFTLSHESVEKIGKIVVIKFQMIFTSDARGYTELLKIPEEFWPEEYYDGVAPSNNTVGNPVMVSNTTGVISFRTTISSGSTIRSSIMYFTK